MIVLSDTSPLNYLVLIGHSGILPVLFRELILPTAVHEELRHPAAPEAVRNWVARPPAWLSIREPSQLDRALRLGAGEAAVLSLAQELHGDLLLMDDRIARRVAEAKGLAVAGTVSLLQAAAERGLVHLPDAVTKLRQTNFHISERILADALAADARSRNQ